MEGTLTSTVARESRSDDIFEAAVVTSSKHSVEQRHRVLNDDSDTASVPQATFIVFAHRAFPGGSNLESIVQICTPPSSIHRGGVQLFSEHLLTPC